MPLTRVPAALRHFQAVAVAFLSREGVLIDANEGFRRLLRSDHCSVGSETIAAAFIQPPFAELMAMSPASDGTLYTGQLTLGPFVGANSSLQARISVHGDIVGFFGEHDIAGMERLQRSMLELNAALTDSQRQLARANRSLEQKARDYASIVETSIDGFARLDEAGHFIEVNQALCALTGFTREQLLQRKLADIDIDGSDGLPAASMSALAAAGGHRERSWRRGDGALIDIEMSIAQTPLCADEFFVFVRDTTVRNEMLRRLRRSELQLRQVADNSSDMISLHDAEGRYLYASQASQRLFGYPAEALRGRLADEFIHPDDLAGVRINAAAEVATGRQIVRRYRFRCASGRHVWVESIARVMPSEQKQSPELIVTTREIDQRQRQEALANMRRNALEMLAAGAVLEDILGSIAGVVSRLGEDLPCCILCLNAPARALLVGGHAGLGASFLHAFAHAARADEVAGPGAAAWRGEALRIDDLAVGGGHLPAHTALCDEGLAAAWILPLKSLDGALLGAFAVFRRHPGFFAADDEIVSNALSLAALAIEHRRTQADLHLAASVYKAIGEAVMVTDAENHISAVNTAFTRTTGYTLEEVIGRDPGMLSSGRQDKQFYRRMWDALLLYGRWQGQIWNRRKNGEEYAEWLTISSIYDERGNLLRRVALFSDITDQKLAEETIWRQANYDSLTQLPNRRLFRDRLQQEMQKTERAGSILALLFLDLDRFKEVNDTLGHDAGDALLVEAAARIRACVRASDTVARLGGDEFTVIMSDVTEPDRVGDVANEIVHKLARPFALGDEQAYVSASVGITLFPADASEVDALIKHADQAMYVAKNSGRNRFSYFTPETQLAAQQRLRLVRDLRTAITDGEFSVFLQPIVDLQDGGLVKLEALLRWQHPLRGWVPPGEFIAVAEGAGLIGDIGDFVFHEVTRVARAWRDECGGSVPAIGINLSPAQLTDPGLCARWESRLRELDLPGEAVVVEVTEGLLLADDAQASAPLACLRAAGMEVAIDDFGTGYSALSYLKRFSVDYLKIALEFIRDMASDPRDQALIEAIIAMAHKLGIKVVAEGVETEEERQLLIAAGCDYAQGYLFARPAPVTTLADLRSRLR